MSMMISMAVALLDKKNAQNSSEKSLVEKDVDKMNVKQLQSFIKELQTTMINGNKLDVEEARRLNSSYLRNAQTEKKGLESARKNGVTEIDYLSVYHNAANDFKGMADKFNSDIAEDRAAIRRSQKLTNDANKAIEAGNASKAKGLLIDAAKSLQNEMKDDAKLRNDAVKIYDPTKK